jgi:hypothetical protein
MKLQKLKNLIWNEDEDAPDEEDPFNDIILRKILLKKMMIIQLDC